eukprot:1521208-Rhodomonas_salina.1
MLDSEADLWHVGARLWRKSAAGWPQFMESHIAVHERAARLHVPQERMPQRLFSRDPVQARQTRMSVPARRRRRAYSAAPNAHVSTGIRVGARLTDRSSTLRLMELRMKSLHCSDRSYPPPTKKEGRKKRPEIIQHSTKYCWLRTSGLSQRTRAKRQEKDRGKHR